MPKYRVTYIETATYQEEIYAEDEEDALLGMEDLIISGKAEVIESDYLDYDIEVLDG